jgi:hypothetical protein
MPNATKCADADAAQGAGVAAEMGGTRRVVVCAMDAVIEGVWTRGALRIPCLYFHAGSAVVLCGFRACLYFHAGGAKGAA